MQKDNIKRRSPLPLNYKDKSYIEPEDLKVKVLSFLPSIPINDESIINELGRNYLGPDEVVALIQVAVSRSVDYQAGLEEELLGIKSQGKGIRDVILKKNLSGIGRGHSLDGLPVLALGINGTKMIDSAFTGMVYSRSLVTSGRRRQTSSTELVVPRSISGNKGLLDEYIQISEDLFAAFDDIKKRYPKKIDAIQAFNKLKPYNDPADLFYVVPLSSIVNLSVGLEDEIAQGTAYLPEEFSIFIDTIKSIVDDIGLGQIYRLRKAVQRETYLHYTIFKDPSPNYATLKHEELGNPTTPRIVGVKNDLPNSALKELRDLEDMFCEQREYRDAAHLYQIATRNRKALSDFCRRYNEAVQIQTISSLSWRVWSEQKRHATLNQQVESIYTAADRAYRIIESIWEVIENRADTDTIASTAATAFVISDKIASDKDMLSEYIYHTARQIMFYGKLRQCGVPERDALYIIPRNIRVRTLESYDLINAVSLELPLRLCTECEPERRMTSEIKAGLMKEQIPELAFLFEPKCNLGYCTEGSFCGNIKRMNPGYNMDVHKGIAQIIASKG